MYSYEATFGNLPDRTVYSNPSGVELKGNDIAGSFSVEGLRETFEVGLKALTTTAGGAGTAGYGMIPVFVDNVITDRTRKWTPVVEIVARVTNRGTTADYNVITAKGGAFVAGEDGAFSETNTTYDRVSVGIKYLYSVGRTTGPTNAAMPAYMLAGFQPAGGALGPFQDLSAPNAFQQEILVKTREIRELEENLIINGSIASDANEFDGIIIQLGATNTVDKNTTAMVWNDVELAAQYAFDDGGRPTFGIGASSVIRDMRKLMLDQGRWNMENLSNNMLGFGIPTAITIQTMIGPITIIPSMYMSNVSGSKAIYFLDLSVIEMRVLQDLTYEKLGKTNDSDKFFLKIYECLVIRAPTFCSSITEIL